MSNIRNELFIVVNRTPPSVNQYRGMSRGWFFLREEAIVFFDLMKLDVGSRHVAAEEFEVKVQVFLAKEQRLDVDNSLKLCLDGLAKCGVFRSPRGCLLSDSYVRRVTAEKFRDPAHPRTEITVKPYVQGH